MIPEEILDSRRMELGLMERFFGSNSATKFLDFMTTYRDFDYSITEIAEKIDVHRRTVQRTLPVLLYYQAIKKSRVVGKANMYKINPDSDIVKCLNRLSTAVSEYDVTVMMNTEGFKESEVLDAITELNQIKRELTAAKD
ncbi:MAG: hypothetical protein V1924_02955 [Candidatus Bathyarchaeota archaeon]